MARRRRQSPNSTPPSRLEPVRVRVRSPIVIGTDRRAFHPAGAKAPAFSFRRADRRIVIKQSSPKAPKRNDTYLDFRVGFAAPKRVAICVRRQKRKEVLHALKRVGKGSGGGRHFWNYWSSVDCK